MAANYGLFEEIPVVAFNPGLEPEQRTAIMVQVGIIIGSTAVLAFLRHLMDAGLFGIESAYTRFGLCIFLAMLLCFGIGLIVLAWFADDAIGVYNAVTRIAVRACQIVLVFAVALRRVCLN